MRFGTRAIAALAAITSLCALGATPRAALASDVVGNPGDYSVGFGGLMQVGFANYSFGSGSPFPLAGHVAPDGGLTVDSASLPPISIPHVSGSSGPFTYDLSQQQLSLQIDSGSGSLDPATGATSIQLALHGSLTAQLDYSESLTHSSGSATISCTIGSAGSPMVIPLSTAGSVPSPVPPSPVSGVPYDQATGAVTLVSGSFTTPDPSCSGGSVLGSALSSVFDLIGAGVGAASGSTHTLWLQGTFTPAFTAPVSPSPGGSTDPPDGGGTATTPTQPPPPPPAVHCVVPKLGHGSLTTVRKKLAAAHCKLGRITRRHSRKFGRNRVLTQKLKAGRTLPAGSAVPVTLSSGKPKPRRHHHH